MIGVAQGMYFNHRRFWLQQTDNGDILLAGHTNKNWYSLKKDLDQVSEYALLPAFTDQQEDMEKEGKPQS